MKRETFAPGPWSHEPNEERWTDETTGYACLAYRHPSLGHWCGYVGVPEAHPLFRVGYSDPSPVLAEDWAQRKQEPLGETSNTGLLISVLCGDDEATPATALVVHGGINYAEQHEPGQKAENPLWWFGFDCAHAGDLAPFMATHRPGYGEYRTLEFVRFNCEQLAAQLKSLEGRS